MVLDDGKGFDKNIVHKVTNPYFIVLRLCILQTPETAHTAYISLHTGYVFSHSSRYYSGGISVLQGKAEKAACKLAHCG